MMKVHPLAEICPQMDDESFQKLKEDIKENGLRMPIWTYEGMILDGRHRYRACDELDIYCPSEEYLGDDPIAFVISTNVHRRQLTPSQRSMIGARAKEEYTKQAKERQRLSKGQGKKGMETVPDLKGAARDLAGAAVSVSGPLIDRASKVLGTEDQPTHPALALAVDQGRMSVSKAAKLADKPLEVQQHVAESSKIVGGAYRTGDRRRTPKEEIPATEATQRQRDKAHNAMNDAINILRKIGMDNPERHVVLKLVIKWCKDNLKEA
jgi:hypothetical protein